MTAGEPTNLDPRQGESRWRRGWAVFLVLVPIAALLVTLWMLDHRSHPDRLTIATGLEGGTYLPLGRGVAALIEDEIPGLEARALETSGSTENVGRLRRREVDFAFVQNDAPGDASIRTVARLYQEVLQIVVRGDREVGQVSDLVGRRVSLGQEGSGTRALSLGVLRHFGLGEGDVQDLHLRTDDAVTAFHAGELDAVAVVAGLRTPAVSDMLEVPGATLLALGLANTAGSSLEGLTFELPGVRPAVVPARAYGAQPAEPVGTIAVEALLVTHRDLSDLLVRQVTRALFDNRFRLSQIHPVASQIEEIDDAKRLRFPLHPGAAGFYARNEPPFLVVYAESISLLITVAITLGSALLALRQWTNRRKKNRVDTYYLRLEEATRGVERARDEEELRALRRQLVALRREAFHDLVAEKLRADQSFAIFQDALGQRLAEIDRARR